MRPIAHLTPQYIFDRISLMLYEHQNPEVPWLTPNMVDLLRSWLQEKDKALEWGSGRSTRWFAQRVRKITSVEHHAEWYEKVRADIERWGVGEDVELIKVSNDNAESYVSPIHEIEDESLDFCLVDGRFRDECALHSLPKLQPGAIIVVDDVHRYLPPPIPSSSPNVRTVEQGPAGPTWDRFSDVVSNWRCIWTTNGVTDTALWVKPAHK